MGSQAVQPDAADLFLGLSNFAGEIENPHSAKRLAKCA